MRYCHYNEELNCDFSDEVFGQLEHYPSDSPTKIKSVLSRYIKDIKSLSFESHTTQGAVRIKGNDYKSALALQGFYFEEIDDHTILGDTYWMYWWDGQSLRREPQDKRQVGILYEPIRSENLLFRKNRLVEEYKQKVVALW